VCIVHCLSARSAYPLVISQINSPIILCSIFKNIIIYKTYILLNRICFFKKLSFRIYYVNSICKIAPEPVTQLILGGASPNINPNCVLGPWYCDSGLLYCARGKNTRSFFIKAFEVKKNSFFIFPSETKKC